MLKFTYTETGIHLEYLNQPLEDLIALRFILAMRVGDRLIAEPGTASFLLPAKLPLLEGLTTLSQFEDNLTTPYLVDSEFVEVNLRGTWVSTKVDGAEGLFLTELGEYTERVMVEVWRSCFSFQSSLTL